MSSHQQAGISRIDSLDYLRGLAALSVMAYHMYAFTHGEADSSTIFAKFKIYGVSIFYILSGLTLYLVNVRSFTLTGNYLKQFYIKRFFRIVPLLWLATALTMVINFHPEYLEAKKLIANITVIPGAIKPETFIANGAWSIGDEIFFYLLFPFLLFFIKKSKAWFWIFVAISVVIFLYFTFIKLNSTVALGMQWAAYVNPLGQMLYFVAGITIGVIERNTRKFGGVAVLAIIAISGFILSYPVSGEPVMLVTGIARVVLSIGVMVLCMLFYKCDFSFLPEVIKKAMRFFGNVSYSVYLIHPIVYAVIYRMAPAYFDQNSYVIIMLTVFSTLVLGHFSYRYFESYFINRGKTMSAKYKS